MLAAGDSLSVVGGRFGLSKTALSRHRDKHLTEPVAKKGPQTRAIAPEVEEPESAVKLPVSTIAAIDHVQAEIWKRLSGVRKDWRLVGVVRVELEALKQLREGIALRARVTGELQPAGPGRSAQPEPEVAGMSDAQLREEWERLNEGAPSGATVN